MYTNLNKQRVFFFRERFDVSIVSRRRRRSLCRKSLHFIFRALVRAHKNGWQNQAPTGDKARQPWQTRSAWQSSSLEISNANQTAERARPRSGLSKARAVECADSRIGERGAFQLDRIECVGSQREEERVEAVKGEDEFENE